ncbi:magnesium transporter [Paraclostridium bifermentans]|nr:magnesium transporter [Paraclostridium bifermentans]
MIGSFIPMMFKKMDVDPSIVSAPLIATSLDIIGMVIYFLNNNNYIVKNCLTT